MPQQNALDEARDCALAGGRAATAAYEQRLGWLVTHVHRPGRRDGRGGTRPNWISSRLRVGQRSIGDRDMERLAAFRTACSGYGGAHHGRAVVLLASARERPTDRPWRTVSFNS